MNACVEALFPRPSAREIEDVLIIARGRKLALQPFFQRGKFGQVAHEIMRQNAVQNLRMRAEMIGQRRRGAHDIGHQFHLLWMALEHRENRNARGQARKELVETDKRIVGVRRVRRVEKMRRQLGQNLPCPFAAHGAVAAVMPAAHGGGDFRRLAEASLFQCFQRFGIVFHACKHKVSRPAEARAFGEQSRIKFFSPCRYVFQDQPRIFSVRRIP